MAKRKHNPAPRQTCRGVASTDKRTCELARDFVADWGNAQIRAQRVCGGCMPMEITELDGPAPTVLGSNRVAPAPVDLEQGGEQLPAGTDKGAELQLMQPPAGNTTAAASDQPQADRVGSGSMLASKSSLKSAQAALLDIRQDATELPHAVRQKVRLARAVILRAYPGTRTPYVYIPAGALPVHVPRHRLRARAA
jgi:hypothetical protein